MNRSALKKYAPQARLDFIEAVTLRARRLGLDPKSPVSVEQTGDVLLIGGQPFQASVAKQRAELGRRIQQQGFAAVVEALAYTWFNRLVAIRFMELKGYLSHGYRVLSHPDGQQPEILEHAHHLDLPGLDKEEVIRLKTAGNQDEALYREILLAQCHELHRNMPFLFEVLDDATELLLPDNLLRTDSLIARMVRDIDEGDWEEVEVIGWLYQFYIGDKKDEVIGKVVKSEDIPAATQLFTPNWIVQYLVQNSLGRLWLMANPGSNLKDKMLYYIEPAEQTPEVQAQLDALIKVRTDEDSGALNPESMTVLDPACGSGHILVEAYNLLRAIYEERGYPLREIPRLILQKNLYGLDIDDRAAQMAGFALLMKAREDDRRLFDDEGNPPHLNVMAIQQSAGLPDEAMAQIILNAAIQIEGGDAFQSSQLFGGGQLETQHSSGLTVLDLRQLIKLFEYGKTFGSLIVVPEHLKAKLGKIFDLLVTVRNKGDELSRSYASQVMEDFAWPASLLALQYDSVIANPPYMGGKGMNQNLKEFAKNNFPDSKSDLFSMFIERGFIWCKPAGFNSMVTMQSWMFLSSYEKFRGELLSNRTMLTMAHMGNGVMGIAFGTAATVFLSAYIDKYACQFSYCNSEDIGALGAPNEFPVRNKRLVVARPDAFKAIPGSPIAYWISKGVVDAFLTTSQIYDCSISDGQNITADNDRFLRFHWELSSKEIGCDNRWVFYAKGGAFRKWFGNLENVVDWSQGARDFYRNNSSARIIPEYLWFKEGITWTLVTSSTNSFRLLPEGATFDKGGSSIFLKDNEYVFPVLAFLNSSVSNYILSVLSSTINLQVDEVRRLPFSPANWVDNVVSLNCKELVRIHREDYLRRETSYGFLGSPLVLMSKGYNLIERTYGDYIIERLADFEKSVALESENNREFIRHYNLFDGRRQKLSATPDLSGTVLPLCLIPNSALKSAPPFKSVMPKASACVGLPA